MFIIEMKTNMKTNNSENEDELQVAANMQVAMNGEIMFAPEYPED